jgi:hypothetical protein
MAVDQTPTACGHTCPTLRRGQYLPPQTRGLGRFLHRDDVRYRRRAPFHGRNTIWLGCSVAARRRELDDTDGRCPGYGEWTFGSTGGPCGLGTKLDLLFAREDTLAGSYQEDSLAVPTTCGGPCSDRRAIVGTVPVTVAG